MPQLAGTGAREHKSQLGLLLHQRMHHIEQLRSLLDLVDHHDEGLGGGRSSDALPEPFQPGQIGTQNLRRQKIQPQRAWKLLGQPGTCPCRGGRTEKNCRLVAAKIA